MKVILPLLIDVKKTSLKKFDGVETKNAAKNLRRSIERNCSDVQFLIVDNEEVICPNTITMEEILSLYFKKQKKMEQLKNVEENIYSSAVAIRKELEECTYNTSWPPSCDELDMDCFPVSPSLRKFLSLVICNDAAPNNDKTERIISLLSQGLFYAVHQRKKLTPEYSPPTFNQIADKQHRTYYHNLKTGTWCVLYKIGRSYH